MKTITDAIHGSVSLPQYIVDLIDTPIVQRLRFIKHLGLVSLGFPSADYSRFSHSIGVFHVASMMLDSIRDNQGKGSISQRDYQAVQVAALLHDIGHYPFSHTIEDAIDQYRSEEYIDGSSESKNNVETSDGHSYLDDHEDLARLIIRTDKDVIASFKKGGIDPEDIISLLDKLHKSGLHKIISSDCDADRIDYLKRTAYFTGVPFGYIDNEYIIRQLCYQNNRVYFRKNAIRPIEHLLLARFAKYQRVVFNKTVAGLEQILKILFKEYLTRQTSTAIRPFTHDWILERILSGKWAEIDDHWMIQKLMESFEGGDDHFGRLYDDLHRRRPPKIVLGEEQICEEGGTSYQQLLSNHDAIGEKIPECAERAGIEWQNLRVWQGKFKPIVSKISSESGEDEDEKDDSAMILGLGEDGEPIPVQAWPASILHPLQGKGLFGYRLYIDREFGDDDEKLQRILNVTKEALASRSESNSNSDKISL